MRKDATNLKETRLQGMESIENYPNFHERHRIFPEVFEDRNHKRILDVLAGGGFAARKIHDNHPAKMLCNDTNPSCLRFMEQQGLSIVCFDIDVTVFPFPDGYFDTVVSLATIEYVIFLDHHRKEILRILSNQGYLYISTPNYTGLTHFPRSLFKGESFHNPLREKPNYEFYPPVRYFTLKTTQEFISSFGFAQLEVYLQLPESSSSYRATQTKSPLKTWSFLSSMWLLYALGSPRWASEPVICFQ